jgi:hypothetical protein
MNDDELEYTLDVLQEISLQSYKDGRKSDSRRLLFIFNLLEKERLTRLDQCGEKGSSLVLPLQDYPHQQTLVGES